MRPYSESAARLQLSAGWILTASASFGIAAIGKFLFWSLAFGIAYTQSPLYTSNQNTKFIHGLAKAGLGFLKEDWLATTIDPIPVFSFLVYITYTHLHEYMFYGYNFLIFGVYLYSLAGIVSRIYKIDDERSKYLTLLTALIALHSYAFDSLSVRAFGIEVGQFLHYGVAEQHLIGRIFQPSIFGVLILLSIHLFLCGRSFLAAFLLGLSAVIHPAYVLNSALITFSYMIVLFREEKSAQKAFIVGLFNFVLILPVLIYFYIQFSPTSPEIWNKASEVLVKFRSPHHMDAAVWLGGAVYAKVALLITAIYLIRKTRLLPIMLLPFLTAILLTAAQIVSENTSLAASTPWRISVFLIPLSASIVIAKFVSYLFERFPEQIARKQQLITVLSFAAVGLLVLYGATAQVKRHVKYYRDDSRAMMDFVKEAKSSGDTYLIPVELEDFRLYTGAPTFVTFKSGPFKDLEYLEWYKRLIGASDFYDATDNVACEMLEKLLVEYDLTHVVAKNGQPNGRCGKLRELYRDKQYVVYKIEKEGSPQLFQLSTGRLSLPRPIEGTANRTSVHQ
jgi:hypothetical protein